MRYAYSFPLWLALTVGLGGTVACGYDPIPTESCQVGGEIECCTLDDCDPNETCNTAANTCVVACTPNANACTDAGAQCGQVDDGCGNTVECDNTCVGNDTCNGNICVVCTPNPNACTDAGAQCGQVDNGCGTMLECNNTCIVGQTCNLDTVTCVPLPCEVDSKTECCVKDYCADLPGTVCNVATNSCECDPAHECCSKEDCPADDHRCNPDSFTCECDPDIVPTTCVEDANCENLLDVDFGPYNDGNDLLGYGVRGAMCTTILGSDAGGHTLFTSREACFANCRTKWEICMETDGEWHSTPQAGDLVCGQISEHGIIDENGCDCGLYRNYVDGQGCVTDPSCEDPTCDDLAGIDFGSCGTQLYRLGYGLWDGQCQEIMGCHPQGHTLFQSLEDCRSDCPNGRQALCLQSGGAWLPRVCGDFICGKPVECSDQRNGCNCGPGRIFEEEVGCSDDETCPPSGPQVCGQAFDVGLFVTAGKGTCTENTTIGSAFVNTVDNPVGVCQTVDACPLAQQPQNIRDQVYPDIMACLASCSTMGCRSNDDCSDSQFCDFPIESNCGVFPGYLALCRNIPEICTAAELDPACGCNGETRGDACKVNRMQTPVAYETPCFESMTTP